MPKRFSWVIEEKLAGMERPGSLCDIEEDLEFLKEQKIDVIVNLEEHLRNYDEFEIKHIPVEDFKAPKQEDFEEFVNFVQTNIKFGRRLVVHCYAGMGRTNLMIASYLTHQLDIVPDIALDIVKERRPMYFVNQEQVEALRNYYIKIRAGITS
jgi:atypical dual specificity phosphatase